MSLNTLSCKVNDSCKKVAAYIVSTSAVLASRGMFYATETQVGTNFNNVAGKLLSEFKSVYCGSLCWLLFGVQVAILFFSKNDKLVAFAKKALFGCIVLYAVLQILVKSDGGAIGNTVNTISNWAGGGA